MFLECVVFISERFGDISWVFRECFGDVSGTFRVGLGDVSGTFWGDPPARSMCCSRAARPFPFRPPARPFPFRPFLSGIFRERFGDVSGMSRGCFADASGMSWERFGKY